MSRKKQVYGIRIRFRISLNLHQIEQFIRWRITQNRIMFEYD